MGVFLVDADVLARARFGTSQLAETVGALGMLDRDRPRTWQRSWWDQHLAAFRARMRDDPVGAAVVRHAFGPTWTADFLTIPPERPGLDLEQELAELLSLSDQDVRRDLEQVRVPLPPELTATGLAATVADVLRWTWTHTIAPTWARRQRVLAADVVARTSRLSRDGWSGVLDGMRPGMRWLGDGELQVNAAPHPPRDIRGSDLTFLAAHCERGWVTWRLEEPARYGIVYPVTGVLADQAHETPDALARLLGPARAQVLLRAAEPVSTSALVAMSGMPLATIGSHLRVLLDAGLLQRRRSGREVLYWWTDSARGLVEGAMREG
jgi:DNA-binding transcriptional ArsR family regulator